MSYLKVRDSNLLCLPVPTGDNTKTLLFVIFNAHLLQKTTCF